MDFDNEYILYRICNGYYYIKVDNIDYKIVAPDISSKYLAHTIYIDIINNDKYDNLWLSSKTIEKLLSVNNLWNSEQESKLEDIQKSLDNTKIQYYLNFFIHDIKAELKKAISSINQNIIELQSKKHYFDYLTLEAYAQNIKNQYLCSTMVYRNGTRIFSSNIEDLDFDLLGKIIPEIYKNTIGQYELKKLARSEIWRSYWTSNKDNVFSGPVINWTDEQRSLVNFTRTLDAIREHMEAPDNDIIEDDDALDGWMLHQHEKITKEKKTQHITEKYNLKDKAGQEVFILESNKQAQKEIFALNDPQTRRDLKVANKLLDQKGTLQEYEIPHVQRELRNQLNSRR